MSRAERSSARMAWALLGTLALAAGAVGVYLSVPSSTERTPSPAAAPR